MLNDFTIIFLSIFLEALPFIFLGLILSAIIQVFVSENTIKKIIPDNLFLGLLSSSLIGFIFPVCECAIIPIARKLIQKGLPVGMGITFMLAVPIVNPVVIASTYFAFNDPSMAIKRTIAGIIISIFIGFIVSLVFKETNPLKDNFASSANSCSHCNCHDHHVKATSFKDKIIELFDHLIQEFFDVGKYLIFGALIAAAFQVAIPREPLLSFTSNDVFSTLTMMILAYIISLCSEADAFVARSFSGMFTDSSILAFLILGPMIDIKNTFLMFSTFKKQLLLVLIPLIIIACFLMSIIFGAF